MRIDALSSLRYGIAASKYGGGAVTTSRRVRRDGLAAFEEIESGLDQTQLEFVESTAAHLQRTGTHVLLLGDDRYPAHLALTVDAPSVLFVRGNIRLLEKRGLGVCGSRNATEEGIKAARASGEIAATLRLPLVSGYARGVDVAAHSGALAAGGTTILVLPQGIDHFAVRRGDFESLWDWERVLVISQFSPAQSWNAGAAMTRNKVICGLSGQLVVVEAGATGGTLAAGLHALENGQPVFALNLPGDPAGNRMLVSRGARAVNNRPELESSICTGAQNNLQQLELLTIPGQTVKGATQERHTA